MFSFNPEMAIGDSMDDGEEAFDAYIRDEDEELDGNVKVGFILNRYNIVLTTEKTYQIFLSNLLT